MPVSVTALGPDVVEVAPFGALDERSARDLRVALLDRESEEAHGGVVLDLSGVESVDAAGIALLLLARLEIEACGGTFVVVAASSPVRRSLRRAGIEGFVQVVRSREQALSVLQPSLAAAAA